MAKVYFFSETDFILDEKDRVCRWIKELFLSEEKKLKELSVIFCDDQFLLELNRKYLNHDTLTDVLAFDHSEGGQIMGDIYISVDRVKDNATIFKDSFHQELHRVIVHGVLHLVGFADKCKESRAIMREKENEYLLLLS